MYDIIGKRRWFYLLSLAVTIPGLIFILLTLLPGSHLGLQFSIDYTGGTEWEVHFANGTPATADVEAVLADQDLPGTATLVTAPDGRQFILIKTASIGLRAPEVPCATPTPGPSSSVNPSASAAASGSASGSPVASGSPAATASAVASSSPAPSASASSAPTGSPSASETVSPSETPGFTLPPCPTPAPSASGAASGAASGSPAASESPAPSPSASPSASASPAPSGSPVASGSPSASGSIAPAAAAGVSPTPGAGNSTESGQLVQLRAALEQKFGPIDDVLVETNVGPVVSAELVQQAILLIAFGAIGIMLWITFRFRDYRMGATAIAALIHDVIVVVGIFAILGTVFGLQLDALFVTAMLTVIGFSVHDTIVVFDRIRENRVRHAGEPFDQIVNHSILQTIGRSINTSLTVLLTLSALFLFGGSAIHSFVLALLIGITSGTYSSIFNASPLLVDWHLWDERRKRRQAAAARPNQLRAT